MPAQQDYSQVRGFNYFLKPEKGGLAWLDLNSDRTELELRRAKEYFPKMNTIRLQLSWSIYNQDPMRFEENFEKVLFIADRLGLKVVATLFSRCPAMGNIWIDHFMEGWNWITVRTKGGRKEIFRPYLKSIVGKHRNDERILIWDICNEPFPYTEGSYGMSRVPEWMREVEQGEYEWLKEMYEICKNELHPQAPLGISVLQDYGREGLERVENISDVLLIHPYYIHDQDNEEEKAKFLKLLDEYVACSKEVKKPLLATETCWPSQDDKWDVENIRFSLSELKKRNIGWIAAKLHQDKSHAHMPATEFIKADGSLRPGHEVFNLF